MQNLQQRSNIYVMKFLVWEEGGGNRRTFKHFNNKINKHKTQAKIQAWSSLVFHCRHSSFYPSEAPPWDSRPVSGAGVVHYHLLHRPRSVPTALSPAPLNTYPHRPSQAGGYPRHCALLRPSSSRGGAHQGVRNVPGVRTYEGREKETEG